MGEREMKTGKGKRGKGNEESGTGKGESEIENGERSTRGLLNFCPRHSNKQKKVQHFWAAFDARLQKVSTSYSY